MVVVIEGMIKKIATIAGIAGLAVPIIILALGVWNYLQGAQVLDQQWFEDDQRWNSDIIMRLDDIQHQVSQLAPNVIVAIDRHEEFVSNEHRDSTQTIISGISTFSDDLNYRIGVHQGEHISAACIAENRLVDGLSHEAAVQLIGELEAELERLRAETVPP